MKKILILLMLLTGSVCGAPFVVLNTNLGAIFIELDSEKAPVSSANFVRYVEDGFYANTLFHRVIAGFMVQGGGFDDKLQMKETHAPIINEADNGLQNLRGSVAMARTNDPHSATGQFFINLVDNDFLNHRSKNSQGWGYAVFGKVVAGMDVVDKIAAVPTTAKAPFNSDFPQQAIVILNAAIVTAQDIPHDKTTTYED